VSVTAALATLVAGAAGLAGCARDGGEAAGRPRLERLAVPWQRFERVGDRELAVFVFKQQAIRLRAATARGTGDRVVITLTGTRRAGPAQPLAAERLCVRVRLDRPLADRVVVDGATGERRRATRGAPDPRCLTL